MCEQDFVALVFNGKDGKTFRMCGREAGPTKNITGPGPTVVYLNTDSRNASRGLSLNFEDLLLEQYCIYVSALLKVQERNIPKRCFA